MSSEIRPKKRFVASLQVNADDNGVTLDRKELAAARKSIMKYKLRDELSYFNRKSLKDRNKNPQK